MTTAQLTVTIIIASWKNTLGRADKLFSTLTEEQFLREVAPGKNRILYLLGHLTASGLVNECIPSSKPYSSPSRIEQSSRFPQFQN